MIVHVIGDAGDADPGWVGERLVQRGAVLHALDRDALPAYGEAGRPGLVLVLGSVRGVREPASAARVAAESAYLRAAREDAVPLLGICYGAQILAHAFGGRVVDAPRPEVGWFEVTGDGPTGALCPAGPWVQFHADAVEPPSGARVLARSAGGVQTWVDDGGPAPVLAWQFHPEVTPEQLSRWLATDDAYARGHGADPDAVRAAAEAGRDATRARTHALTDAALDHLRVPAPPA